MRRPRLLVLPVLGAALTFGVAVAVLKGNGPGLRDTVGNVSAPWLLLPFAAGALVGGRRVWRAAAVGGLASLLAVGGFYVANSFVLDLGPHPWPVDLRLAVTAGRDYFVLALLSGPVFGALGGYWRRTGSTLLAVAVAALLIFEPMAWMAYLAPGESLAGAGRAVVWILEAGLGICACIALAAGRLRRDRLGGMPPG